MSAPHPLAIFGQTRIINLASRADRREEMQEQLGRIGLGFGVGGVERFDAVRPGGPGGFPSLGARGCFLSHLGVLRQAREQGAESVLILEDDLNFSEGFAEQMRAASRQLAAEPWCFFYGGYVIEQSLQARVVPLQLVEPVVPIGTTHFVAVHSRVLDDLIQYLEAILDRHPGDPAGGPMHVDGAYCWYRRAHPEAQTWVAVPELGYQRASRTDIHELSWHDRMPVVRHVVAWARRVRNG